MKQAFALKAIAALAAGVVFAAGSTLAAADPPGGQHGGPHGGAGIPHASGGSRVGMPPRGFRGAPPTFHGSLPQGTQSHGTIFHPGPRYQLGQRGHDLGLFNGRHFGQFGSADRDAWRGGAWRHESHNGHLGWWWVTGGLWFFYPAPIYPYPDYVGPDYYYDYYGSYPTPSYYWYYCEDPPGYYPDVQQCNVEWEPAPPQ